MYYNLNEKELFFFSLLKYHALQFRREGGFLCLLKYHVSQFKGKKSFSKLNLQFKTQATNLDLTLEAAMLVKLL